MQSGHGIGITHLLRHANIILLQRSSGEVKCLQSGRCQKGGGIFFCSPGLSKAQLFRCTQVEGTGVNRASGRRAVSFAAGLAAPCDGNGARAGGGGRRTREGGKVPFLCAIPFSPECKDCIALAAAGCASRSSDDEPAGFRSSVTMDMMMSV